MRKHNIAITILLATTLMMISCNQDSKDIVRMTNKYNDIDIHKINISKTNYSDQIGQYISVQKKAYIDSEITINARFIKELDYVNYGFSLDQYVSQNAPDGRDWSDSLLITEDRIGRSYVIRNKSQISINIPEIDIYGEYEIAVTGIPKDGTGALTLYATIEVIPKPKIEIEYNNRLFGKEQTVRVISDKPVDLVLIKDQDGNVRRLSTKDSLTYKTNLTLNDRSNGQLKLEVYDKYGFNFKKDMYVYDPEEIRLCNFDVNFRVDGGQDTLSCISYNTQGKDERYDFVVEIPDHIDYEYRTKLMKHPTAKRYGIPYEGERIPSSIKGEVMGASPNGKWLKYSFLEEITFYREGDINSCFKEDQFLVRDVKLIHFVLLNTTTRATTRIGTRYIKGLVTGQDDITGFDSRTFIESGEFYYVLKWADNDEVYLLEQKKDDKIYNIDIKKAYKNMYRVESPHASARIIRLTLEDAKIHDSNFEPPRAWVGYTDQQTGITGYVSPSDDYLYESKYSQLTDLNYNSIDMTVISTLDGTKKHTINEFNFVDFINSQNQYERISSSGWLLNTYIHSSGYINEIPYALISVMYCPSKERSYRTHSNVLLNIKTGELRSARIIENSSTFASNHSFRIANMNNRIYFIAQTEDNTHKFMYISDDLKIHIENEVESSFLDSIVTKPIYIKKGGWHND